MKVILKKDEFNELNKVYEVYKIENNKIYLNEHRWVSPTLVEKYIEGENMKTTIYELLGMIKDGKAPEKILWKDEVFGLSEDNKNYIDEDSDWLFIDYEWLDMLNDEIIILETTITYKQDDYCQYQPYTGEFNLKPQQAIPYEPYTPPIKQNDKIAKLEEKPSEIRFAIQNLGIETVLSTYSSKINGIIDILNK